MLSLKEATAEKHKIAEHMPFNVRMFIGVLTKQEYLLYLSQQLLIFSSIEENTLPHKNLYRKEAILQDINELKRQGYNVDHILNSTQLYVNHLNKLRDNNILPHVYLNYLAIIFGGQIIKKRVPSSGKMYDFIDSQNILAAIRKIQKDEWAEEVNKGYDFVISILNELEIECRKL